MFSNVCSTCSSRSTCQQPSSFRSCALSTRARVAHAECAGSLVFTLNSYSKTVKQQQSPRTSDSFEFLQLNRCAQLPSCHVCILSRLSVHNVLSDVARRVCTVSPRQESARLRPHSPVLLLSAFVSSATTSYLSCVIFSTNQVFAFQCSVLLIFCRLQVRKSRPTRR